MNGLPCSTGIGLTVAIGKVQIKLVFGHKAQVAKLHGP